MTLFAAASAPPPIRCGTDHRPPSRSVRRKLDSWGATTVFDEYWRFAAARQDVLVRRLAGQAPPWTDDDVITRYRFTNPYRFTDRVSQFLIREVQYDSAWDARSLVLRTLFFKIFNRIPTWQLVISNFRALSYSNFDLVELDSLLNDARNRGQRIYSAAYISPNPAHGQLTKHANHLHMLQYMIGRGIIDALAKASELRELFEILIQVPSLGRFLAFQFAVDINYSTVTQSEEWDFVVAGPGAKAGLRKCFTRVPAGAEEEVIYWVAQTQGEHFERLGIEFPYLFDRKLRPVDCQNLFCEVDKYARVRFPQLSGTSGRSRIKQGFSATSREALEPLVIPQKWREVSLPNASSGV
jgi:5-hmdU DNA kinase, helical domain